MDWQRILLFFLPLAILKNTSRARVCSRPQRDYLGLRTNYYCCTNYRNALKKGKCEECSIGFTSNAQQDKECKKCPENNFGNRCLEICNCKENERCDNVYGCVSPFYAHSTISVPLITHDSEIGFQDKERFIYIGSSGLLVIVVFILITYICYRKTGKNLALDNAKSNVGDEGNLPEKHVVRVIINEKSTDENDYEEIDDSLLCDIKFPAQEENYFDFVEDDNNSVSIKEDCNEGYLNPYQPIISTEVDIDVHHYDSTKDYSTTLDENQRSSGYIRSYQARAMNSTEAKHEYTEIEHLDTGNTGIQKERGQGDYDE